MIPSITVREPLSLPIRVIRVDDLPKIIAGGVPVTPLNVVLGRRARYGLASPASLNVYVRAASLYAKFCAHLRRSIFDVTDNDFSRFTDALLGLQFSDFDGNWVSIDGRRGGRTADLMISLLYSMASEMEKLYGVRIDWCRYEGEQDRELSQTYGGPFRRKALRRTHRIKFATPKIVGLPDDQFVLLLRAAYERWGNIIPTGDLAFAKDPEAQRGALFFRNIALLFVLRGEGGRRHEATLIDLDDIDRENSVIRLVTKGRGGASGERLPVVLFPTVYELIWLYVTNFLPVTGSVREDDAQAVFRSHSVQNYGRRIGDETVRKVVKELRTALDPPWDKILTPHMLRHSFGYDMQRLGGAGAVMTGLRHSSILSSVPYAAGPEIFADELIEPANAKIIQLLAKAGLTNFISGAART